jgi:hypothetical protein
MWFLALNINSEKELFDLINKLELSKNYIDYYKFWNELQFKKFTINYCNNDGYKLLLTHLDSQKKNIKKSRLWNVILEECWLDEEKVFWNNIFLQLKGVHNQYIAQTNFDELAKFNCDIFNKNELVKKCREMKFSLVKFNKKTCDDLIFEKDKIICNSMSIKK